MGETASTAVQEFAETGSTKGLDRQQGDITTADESSSPSEQSLVLDGFSAPPIEGGVGKSQGSVFLDGNHTMVKKRTNFTISLVV